LKNVLNYLKKNDSSNKYKTLNLNNFLKLSYIFCDINTNLYFSDKLFKIPIIILYKHFFMKLKNSNKYNITKLGMTM